MKKLLVLLTVLAIMLSTCIMGIGATASAAQLELSPDGDFVAFDGIIEEYIGPGGTVVVPSVIDGEPITEIASYAFANNADISEVYISEGIEIIGYRAFYQCTNMYKIELPYSIYQAGSQAFGHCGLESITIPGGLEVLEYSVCGTNKLKEVVLSYGVREILTSSFGGNFNMDVIIPESVEIFCGFTFNFPQDKGGSKFIICNPNVEIGYQANYPTKDGVKDNLNHNWDTSGATGGITPPCYSAVDATATMTYIFPEGSKAGKVAEDKFQAFCESTKGSGCDVSGNKMRVVYEDEAYFEDLFEDCGGKENWGTTKKRADLDLCSTSGGNTPGGSNDPVDGDEPSNGTDGGNTQSGNKKPGNSSSSDGSVATIYDDGDNSSIGLIIGIVGVVFVLIIGGLVVFLIIFLKPKKKAPTADELRAQLAAAEAAEEAVEAPVEDAPTEDAPADDAE